MNKKLIAQSLLMTVAVLCLGGVALADDQTRAVEVNIYGDILRPTLPSIPP